ncbi:MAG: hypothetical protein M0C28_21715 [Candidatus Moduliflexus flocculans]|nr:hypothetical protein [Candidatus Moduliflexus flocculans]
MATLGLPPRGLRGLVLGGGVLLMRAPARRALPGVGPVLSRRFDLLGIREIGDLAGLSASEARALGERGPELAARARGIDAAPWIPSPPELRVERGRFVFEPDASDPEILGPRLDALASELAYCSGRKGLGARRVRVELSYADGFRSAASAGSSGSSPGTTRSSASPGKPSGGPGRAASGIRRIAVDLYERDSAGPELDLFEPGTPASRSPAGSGQGPDPLRLRRRGSGPPSLAARPGPSPPRARGEACSRPC